MKNFILILLIVVSSSCVTQKKCTNKFPPTESFRIETVTKDSVVYRDTTIYVNVPGKEVIIEKPVEVKSPTTGKPIETLVDIDTMSINNYYYTALAWVNNSIMGMQLTPKIEMFELQTKYMQLYKIKDTKSEKEIVREVKVVPRLYKIAFIIVVLEIIIVLMYLCIRAFFKRYFP